jgi:hypothetical protein
VRSKGPKTIKTQAGFWTTRTRVLIIGGAVGVIALSFVLPGLFRSSSPSEAAHAKAIGVAVGAGMPAGRPVPSFSEKNLLDGPPISSKTVYDGKSLLFCSEGVL